MKITYSAISLEFVDKEDKTIDVPLKGSGSSCEILLECGHNYRLDTVGSLSKLSKRLPSTISRYIYKQEFPVYLSIGPGVESTGPSIQPTDHTDITTIFKAHSFRLMLGEQMRGEVETKYLPITISVPDDPRGNVTVVDKDGYQSKHAF